MKSGGKNEIGGVMFFLSPQRLYLKEKNYIGN